MSPNFLGTYISMKFKDPVIQNELEILQGGGPRHSDLVILPPRACSPIGKEMSQGSLQESPNRLVQILHTYLFLLFFKIEI